MFEEKFGAMLKKTVKVEDGVLSLGKKVQFDIDEIQAIYITEPTFSANGTVYISQDGQINKDILEFQKCSFNYIKKQADALSELVEIIDAPVLEGISSVDVSKDAFKEMKTESVARKQEKNALKCPKCGSHEIQFVGNKRKGFSVGKAVGGAVLTGGIGTLAGFAGGKGKKNEFVCMNCGKTFIKKA